MAPRIFGKRERYMPIQKGRHRRSRPKSFKTEQAAQAYATLKGIKNFTLKNLKNPLSKEKKLVIVPK